MQPAKFELHPSSRPPFSGVCCPQELDGIRALHDFLYSLCTGVFMAAPHNDLKFRLYFDLHGTLPACLPACSAVLHCTAGLCVAAFWLAVPPAPCGCTLPYPGVVANPVCTALPYHCVDRKRAFTDGQFVWFNGALDPGAFLLPTTGTTGRNINTADWEQYRGRVQEHAPAWFEAICDALAHFWAAQHDDTTDKISCRMQRCFRQKFDAFLRAT